MKSISIHGIDEEIEKKIGERAKIEGKSVNRIVKEMIAKSLGLGERPSDDRAKFADLCGIWTKEEAAEFMEAVTDFNSVNLEDWR